MKLINSLSDIANIVKQSRRKAKLKQVDFAQHLGVSRDLIIRIERGEDVGLQALLSIFSAMGYQVSIDEALPSNVQIVENFDEYYHGRFRSDLESRAKREPSKQGFLESEDRKRMSILNLKKSFDIQ